MELWLRPCMPEEGLTLWGHQLSPGMISRLRTIVAVGSFDMTNKLVFATSAFDRENNFCFYPCAKEQVFSFLLQGGQPFRDPDFIFIFETILDVTQAGLKLAMWYRLSFNF